MAGLHQDNQIANGIYKNPATATFLAALAVFIIVFKCIPLYSGTFINGDTAWFLHIAKLYIQGNSLREIYFDTNPPFPVLLYAPLVIAQNLSGFSLHVITHIFCFGLIGLNALTCFLCLRKTTQNTAISYSFIIVFLYVALINNFSLLGHKDYLAALAIPPIVLIQLLFLPNAQLDMNSKWRLFFYAVFTINMIVILLKPHYYLIPMAMLIGCLALTRSYKTLLGYESIAIFGLPTAYLICNYVILPDYFTDAPALLKDLYAPPVIYITTGFTLYLIGLIMLARGVLIAKDKNVPLLILVLINAAISCLAVFIIQSHGFITHTLPLQMMTILLISVAFIAYFEKEKIPASALILLLFAAIVFSSHDARIKKLYQNTYAMPVHKIIEYTSKISGKTYFIESSITDPAYTTELYNGKHHVSRFPSRWMLDFMESRDDEDDTISRKDAITLKKFSEMIVEDFTISPPDHLFLYKDNSNYPATLFSGGKTKSMRDHLANDPDFKTFLSGYEKVDEMTIEYSPELHIGYDVLRKK